MTLARVGINAEVIISTVDEDALESAARQAGPVTPVEVADLLARAKAEDVAASLGPREDAFVVLGCDSVLELDGEVHGKPGTAEVAIARWQRMRGRSGVLHTGHHLVTKSGAASATASTVVHFADLSDAEIEAYVATGEPLRVAGAFTVDGLGGAFVRSIVGDHHNVVGLSLPLLRTMLGELDIDWFQVASG